MKQRGVHDVFHVSLLRIHELNDNWLFPGHLDNQIGQGLNLGQEWAINQILSHHGSSEGSIFEIKWQSRDVTWMPYYQIKHLQALSDYFELLGIQNISELPKGKGSPSQEDLQIFLGSVSMSMSSPLPASIHFDNTNYVPQDKESPFINPDIPLILTSSLTSPTYDTHPSTPEITYDMPNLLGIQHPRFTCRSKTKYTIIYLDHCAPWHIHVGQIMLYLAFNHLLCNEIDVSRLPGIPLGYNNFTTIFNKGNHPHDNRKLSTLFPRTSRQPDYINKSTSPIYLQDFYITLEQCGLSSPRDSGILDMQALILEDYTTSQALKNK